MRVLFFASMLVLSALFVVPAVVADDLLTPQGDDFPPPLGANTVGPVRYGPEPFVSYPLPSMRHHEQGKALLAFTVTPDGTVSDIQVLKSSGYPALDKAAVMQIAQHRYLPALRAGQPVAVPWRASIAWALPGVSAADPPPAIPPSNEMFCVPDKPATMIPQCAQKQPAAAPDVTALYRIGLAYENHGDHALAEPYFSQVLQREPGNVAARVSRARAYAFLGRDDDALADLAATVSSNAADGEMISHVRGFIYEKRGDYQKAVDNYSAAMDVKGNVVATMDRGLAYQALGRADLAAADFRTGASMAVACACKPASAAQIAAFDQRIAKNPDDVGAFANRCVQRSVLGQELSMALADCNHVQARMAGEPNTLEARGLIFLRRGQPADALEDFNAALATEPRRATAIYLRGIAKLRSGESATAHADFLTARSIDSSVAVRIAITGILPG